MARFQQTLRRLATGDEAFVQDEAGLGLYRAGTSAPDPRTAAFASFGVGPLQHAGLSLSAIFGGTALVAAALAVLSFVVSPVRPGLRHGRVTNNVVSRAP